MEEIIYKNLLGYLNTVILSNGNNSWGPPRVKVRGGGKGSWTERQIGMLPVVTLLCINKVKCH